MTRPTKRPPIWCLGRAREQISPIPSEISTSLISGVSTPRNHPEGDHLLVGGTTAGGKEGSPRFGAAPNPSPENQGEVEPRVATGSLETQPGDGVLATCSQVSGNSDVFLRFYHVPPPAKINN